MASNVARPPSSLRSALKAYLLAVFLLAAAGLFAYYHSYTAAAVAEEASLGLATIMLASVLSVFMIGRAAYRIRRENRQGPVEDSVAGASSGIVNIADRKPHPAEVEAARQAAEAADHAKSAFLANMSHEIRTPMNGIIGMTELLLRTPLSTEQQEYAEIIHTSSETLLSLINDILDFSKIEAGHLDLETCSFDVRSCIDHAFSLVALKASEKGLDLAADVAEAVPDYLLGDEIRLRQIILNLLSNAVKFTEQGEVLLSAGASMRDDGRYEVQFSVRDTGIGIPHDQIARLFDRFSQMDSSTTRKYGGTGLGLAISKKLAELMGGRIWVESTPGEGATFSFSIVAEAGQGGQPAHRRADRPDLAGRRVLIVDDQEANRRILARQVQHWGMTPVTVASGRDALGLISSEEAFDVAMLDLSMPEMDGIVLAKTLRVSLGASSLPLVLLSPLGDHARLAGTQTADLFIARLSKPVRFDQLYDTLHGIFCGSGVQQQGAVTDELDVEIGRNYPLRLLLVEDNPVNQQVMLRLLDRLGYMPDVADNGAVALEDLQANAYDVVLMDVQMPEMDGIECTRQIRALPPAHRQPWIIGLTAHALAGDRERLLEAGMDDYIPKPVKLHALALAFKRAAQVKEPGQSVLVEPPPPPVLDISVLEQLRRDVDDPEGLEELLNLFRQNTPDLVGQMRKGAGAGMWKRVEHGAHSLKSTSAMVGALRLSSLCFTVEKACREGEMERASALLPLIEHEAESVVEALAVVA